MKKNLLKSFAVIATMFVANANAQVTFIDKVSAVNVTTNIMYDSNAAVNIMFGAVPGLQPLFSNKLMCDVYSPTSVSGKKPLIILAHTGSYLPAIVNRQTTGNRKDSSIVFLANELAARGYVVAAIDYRSGWNPTTTNQSAATEQLLKATYRGLQDVANAVRFFRTNQTTYDIDTAKIIVGGQGTGGYISYAVATVNTRGDIENNLKFLRNDLSPMVSMDTLGDWTGLGGVPMLNFGADANVSSKAHMTFNFGGAMGDTAWMKANSLPIVSLQCTKDPFAPYLTGNVIVPTTGITVIPNASGAGHVIPKANALGINNKLNSVFYVDPISLRALDVPDAENNLFGFESSFAFENSPWEWWNRPFLQAVTAVPYAGSPLSPPTFGFLPANGREADSLSMRTNPNMSDIKGKAYVDTIAKFVAPRIAVQFDLTGSVGLNNFDLVAPAAGTSAIVYDSADLFITVRWQHAKAAGAAAGTTMYIFQLDLATGDFSEPAVEEPIIDADSMVVDHATLWGLLDDLGAPANTPLPLKWRVIASNDYFAKLSSQEFAINLTKNEAVGLRELNLQNFVKVFPNPAKEMVKVSMDQSKSPIQSVSIMDIMGREILSVNNINAHQTEINTAHLNPGIYIINVVNNQGNFTSKRLSIN